MIENRDQRGTMKIEEIDWNEVWKTQIQRNKDSSPGRDCLRIWESRESALRFWNMSHENKNRVDETVWSTDTKPDSHVLDIGAGPGTLAIPFAQKVSHVTAIEPAAGMVSVLKEMMAEHAVNNIDVVQKRWEDVDAGADLQPPYDVVMASFSLGMEDIRAALEKMNAVSSRYVYLYHFAGPTSWDLQWKELWPKLHGKEYHLGPKSDVLYNVLYQMGIYPHVRTFRLQHNQRYASMDEAFEALRPQAKAETAEQVEIFRDYLRMALREEGGHLVWPGSSIRVKMWWEKEIA
jgi:ubiquinone/menaquinone biosynthesis C-methylase UbiE